MGLASSNKAGAGFSQGNRSHCSSTRTESIAESPIIL